MKLILITLTYLFLFATASADLDKIQGTWKAASGQIGGKDLPKALLDKMVLKIKGNTYDYDEGNGHVIGTVKVIAGTSPFAMDIAGTKGPNKGRTYKSIYRIDGSTLTIYYGLDGHRPGSFDEKGKPMTLLMKFHRAD